VSAEEQYQEVSLRAVELLARAQRAADEAVAEAQSYARDLEESAREQYKQILQRAQSAAQLASAGGAASGVGQGIAGAGDGAGTIDAQKLTYVRTYARVAHAQLKSVLAALNDELDQLAALAEDNVGTAQGPPPADPSTAPKPAAGPQTTVGPQATAPRQRPTGLPAVADVLPRTTDKDEPEPDTGGAPQRIRWADDGAWPPIFAATNAITYTIGEHRTASPSEKPGLY
jgi:hypothetical protein